MSSSIITAYVGLGSNLQNPVLQIQAAILALHKLPATSVIASSSLYQTSPVGWLDQPNFINATCAVHTTLPARSLLSHLLAIEQQHGRLRNGKKNQARTLDLDLLLYDNQIIHEANLSIPHPRLHQRAFVLAPLAEIAPNLTLPDGSTIMSWLKKIDPRDEIIKL